MRDSIWEVILNYWTVTIFLPAILVVLTIFAIITRITDRD